MPNTDTELRLFKCNNPRCNFEVVGSYDSTLKMLPDSDCEMCGWHDSVQDIGSAEPLKETINGTSIQVL